MTDLPEAPEDAIAAPAPDPVAEFQAALAQTIRAPLVTYGLIAVNVLIFGLMIASGVGFMEPSATDILAWGGSFAPRTAAGEWWRLLSSNYVHIGAFHLLMNLAVLFDIGPFMERSLGHVGFLALYTASGIAGSVLSLWVHSNIVCAGASGAIFGLYGGLAGLLLRNPTVIPAALLKRLGKGAAVFVGFNLLNSFLPNVDMAGHVGGLLGGFAIARWLDLELTGDRARVTRRTLILSGGVVGIVFGAATLVKPGVDFDKEIATFTAIENKALARFQALVEGVKGGTITDAQAAQALAAEILPPWRSERARLGELNLSPGKQRVAMDTLLVYIDAREAHWTALEELLRTQDKSLLEGMAGRVKAVEAALEKVKQLAK